VVDDFIPICGAEATYHNGRNQTDTETGDDTATDDETDSSRSDLEGDTDGEDAASDDDRQPSSDPIREGSTTINIEWQEWPKPLLYRGCSVPQVRQ
jgi:hypothetical protein